MTETLNCTELVYGLLRCSYQMMPQMEGRPGVKMLVLPSKKHRLVISINPGPRQSPEEKLTALLIANPQITLSEHIASFCLTKQGLTSLSLPSEYVLVDQIPTIPGQVVNFKEKYNSEMSVCMASWFRQIVKTQQFIDPPHLFINSANLM